jgi:putative transposase
MPSMWIKTYYVGTAGNVSAEEIKRYIEECQEHEDCLQVQNVP